MKTFDVMDRTTYIDFHSPGSKPLVEKYHLSSEDLEADIHAIVKEKISKGLATYQLLAARIPLFWPLHFGFKFTGIRSLGNRVYRNISLHRQCRVDPSYTSVPHQKNRHLSNKP